MLNKISKKLALVLLVTVVLTNCSRNKDMVLSIENKTNVNGKSLLVVDRNPPSFYAITNSRAFNSVQSYSYDGIAGAGGGYSIAANAAASHINAMNRLNFFFSEENKERGEKIIKDNNIKDPGSIIRESILESFKKKYNPKSVDHGDFYRAVNYRESYVNDVPSLSKHYKDFDLILDVGTSYWSTSDFGSQNPPQFSVSYQATLRLIDTKNKKVIARGSCANLAPRVHNPAPTYEKLLSNKAKIIKLELDAQTKECVKKFKSEILDLK